MPPAAKKATSPKYTPEVDDYANRMSPTPAPATPADPAPVATKKNSTRPAAKKAPAKKKGPAAPPVASPAPTPPASPKPSPAASSAPQPGSSYLDRGSGFVLGLLFWTWIALPFLQGGPTGVKNQLRAKFLNQAADGSPLP